MKHIIIIILALAIFLQPFSKMWIYVSFKINQDNIAKTLCVKKDIKNNCCKGSCHLKKELDKADKEEQKQAPTNQKEKYEVFYYSTAKPYGFLKCVDTFVSKLNSTRKNFFRTSSYITDIFRPPKTNLI